MSATHSSTTTPAWWSDSHGSGWERIKDALRRDWEQTKADLTSKKGHELNQGIGDTVRQALGKEPVPPPNVPNPPEHNNRWEDVEPAMRYGYGARQQFGAADKAEWDEEMELQLRREWENINPGRTWHDVRQFVHRGWMGP